MDKKSKTGRWPLPPDPSWTCQLSPTWDRCDRKWCNRWFKPRVRIKKIPLEVQLSVEHTCVLSDVLSVSLFQTDFYLFNCSLSPLWCGLTKFLRLSMETGGLGWGVSSQNIDVLCFSDKYLFELMTCTSMTFRTPVAHFKQHHNISALCVYWKYNIIRHNSFFTYVYIFERKKKCGSCRVSGIIWGLVIYGCVVAVGLVESARCSLVVSKLTCVSDTHVRIIF